MNERYQKLFDKAVQGILAQGCPSLGYVEDSYGKPGGGCAYRGVNGSKCAIGHLLTDEQMKEYDIKEGTSPEMFPGKLLRELLPNMSYCSNLEFLMDLQDVHDKSSHSDVDANEFLKNFRMRAGKFAEKWNLNKKVLEQ